jgi:predicted permease
VLLILSAIIPVFLLLVLGNLLRRLGFPDGRRSPESGGFWQAADRLVYWVLFPALLFQETSHAPLGDGTLGSYALILLGAMLVSGLVTLAVARLSGASNEASGSIFQGALRHNTFIRLRGVRQPVRRRRHGAGQFGDGGAGAGYECGGSHRAGPAAPRPCRWGLGRRLVQELVRNPFLIAIGLGLICNIAGLPVPQVVRDSLGLLARVALPLALLCIGAALHIRALRRAGLPTLISLLGKLALFPALSLVW